MADIVIAVATDDASDLSALGGSVGDAADSGSEFEIRSLDGETVAVLVIALTSQSVQVIGQWLVARARAKKSTSVTVDGVTVTADSVDAVERLLAQLEVGRGFKRGKRSGKPSKS